MKKQKSLSDLIKQAKNSKPEYSVGEVKTLLDSGKESALQHRSSYRPRRINKMFNPLNLIVMTLIIAMLTTVLLLNPLNNKGADGSFSEELQVAGSKLQVEENKFQDAPTSRDLRSAPTGYKIQVEKKNNKVELSTESKSLKPSASTSELDGTPQEQVLSKALTKDTIINGTIFELSKEQLEKLGFMFDDEGYYYLNKMPDGSLLNFWSFYGKMGNGKGGSFGFGKGGWINKSNKQSQTQFDFYPQVITDMAGKPIGQVIRKETDVISAEEFEEINDELIPILFRYEDVGGYEKQDIIVWFKASEELLILLKKIEGVKQEQIKMINLIWVDKSRVIIDYNFEIGFESIEGLKLDKETLECLGFALTDSSMDYQYEYNGDWITFFSKLSGVGYNNYSLSKFKNLQDSVKLIESPPLLCGITDYLGKYHMTLPVFSDITRENAGGDFFDYCIPVKMVEIRDLPNIEKSTFWFYPNERFFNCLPDSISEPMKKEFNYHKKQSGIVDEIVIEDFVPDTNTEPVPCEYFPSFCEGLPGLDQLLVYPNPAEEIINIDVLLSRGKTIDFRIFDLSGRLLLDDHPRKAYKSDGKYTERMDIRSLTPGLYLLVLTDDEGAKMTKRIVKN